jgi:tRNA threonylcarbamoyladenosine biosynthesis protein TsaB
MSDDRQLVLLIETSGPVGRVGLAAGSELLTERDLDPARRHARDLAPTLEALLREQGRRPRDLAGVIVSLGPGSYTGLRVGVMSAKALAWATGCALVGVPTFEAIARRADVAGDVMDVIADAQKGKLYVQRFSRSDRSAPFAPEGQLAVIEGRQWVHERTVAVPVVGSALRPAAAWLPAETPAVDAESTIAGLLAAGLDRWHDGRCDDPLRLEPIYLRPSSAEEQWARRGPAGER